MVLVFASTISLASASACAPDAAPVHMLLGMVTCCGGPPGCWIATVSGWVAHAPRSVAVSVARSAKRLREAPRANRRVLVIESSLAQPVVCLLIAARLIARCV